MALRLPLSSSERHEGLELVVQVKISAAVLLLSPFNEPHGQFRYNCYTLQNGDRE